MGGEACMWEICLDCATVTAKMDKSMFYKLTFRRNAPSLKQTADFMIMKVRTVPRTAFISVKDKTRF